MTQSIFDDKEVQQTVAQPQNSDSIFNDKDIQQSAINDVAPNFNGFDFIGKDIKKKTENFKLDPVNFTKDFVLGFGVGAFETGKDFINNFNPFSKESAFQKTFIPNKNNQTFEEYKKENYEGAKNAWQSVSTAKGIGETLGGLTVLGGIGKGVPKVFKRADTKLEVPKEAEENQIAEPMKMDAQDIVQQLINCNTEKTPVTPEEYANIPDEYKSEYEPISEIPSEKTIDGEISNIQPSINFDDIDDESVKELPMPTFENEAKFDELQKPKEEIDKEYKNAAYQILQQATGKNKVWLKTQLEGKNSKKGSELIENLINDVGDKLDINYNPEWNKYFGKSHLDDTNTGYNLAIEALKKIQTHDWTLPEDRVNNHYYGLAKDQVMEYNKYKSKVADVINNESNIDNACSKAIEYIAKNIPEDLQVELTDEVINHYERYESIRKHNTIIQEQRAQGKISESNKGLDDERTNSVQKGTTDGAEHSLDKKNTPFAQYAMSFDNFDDFINKLQELQKTAESNHSKNPMSERQGKILEAQDKLKKLGYEFEPTQLSRSKYDKIVKTPIKENDLALYYNSLTESTSTTASKKTFTGGTQNDNIVKFADDEEITPKYFKNRNMEINSDLPAKENTKNLREIYSSNVNSTKNETSYLNADINKLVPSVAEKEGLIFYRDFGGDEEKIKAAIENPIMAEHAEALKLALKPSENMLKANKLLEENFNESAKVLTDKGILKKARANYIPHDILNEEIPPETTDPKRLKKNTKNAEHRGFDTIYEGMQNNVKYNLDLNDLITKYNSEKAHIIANRDLLNILHESGTGKFASDAKRIAKNTEFIPTDKIPKGFVEFAGEKLKPSYVRDEEGNLKLNEDGNPIQYQKKLYVPKDYAKGLKAITDKHVDWEKDGHPFLAKIDHVQGVLKTVKLSFSLFHDKAMGLVYMYQNRVGLGNMALKNAFDYYTNANKLLEDGITKDNERDFIRHTGTTSNIESNIDVVDRMIKNVPELEGIVTKPVIKQLLQANDKRTNFLFGKYQRLLKINDYTAKVNDWMKKNQNASPEKITKAKTEIARQINAAYGGLNWVALGRTPLFRAITKLVFLAPDWTYSNIDFFRQGLSKGASASIVRKHVTASLLGGGIATELLNYAITGHFTDKNDKGHEFEIQLPHQQYISLFPGQSGDAIKLYSKVSENGVSGVSEFAKNKLSPVGSAAMTALGNRNYYGGKVTDDGLFGKNSKKHPLNNFQKSGNYVAGVLDPLSPVPITASANYQLYKNGETNPAMYAPSVLGLSVVREERKGKHKSHKHKTY